MKRQAFSFFTGIFLGYVLVYAFKALNTNLFWTFFYPR